MKTSKTNETLLHARTILAGLPVLALTVVALAMGIVLLAIAVGAGLRVGWELGASAGHEHVEEAR